MVIAKESLINPNAAGVVRFIINSAEKLNRHFEQRTDTLRSNCPVSGGQLQLQLRVLQWVS